MRGRTWRDDIEGLCDVFTIFSVVVCNFVLRNWGKSERAPH